MGDNEPALYIMLQGELYARSICILGQGIGAYTAVRVRSSSTLTRPGCGVTSAPILYKKTFRVSQGHFFFVFIIAPD